MNAPSQVPVAEDEPPYDVDSAYARILQPLRKIKASDTSHWLARYQAAEVKSVEVIRKRKAQPAPNEDIFRGSTSSLEEFPSAKKLRKSHSTPFPMYPHSYSSPSMWMASKLEAYKRDEELTTELSTRLEKVMSDN
ncbi:unnamed protein product [Schistocephalus solidus]|uniref:Uncharacterized protein n=1 Tax=Schistocephalus solidus TaxID=70667 RepID=A0A183TG72_SCHSO|nr:unnamed protein product [Schistocephalus solidus]